MDLAQVTADAFEEEVERSSRRVVVDFYADWCYPCKQVVPALKVLSSRWDGRIRFVKVDVDENRELAERYEVSTVPTLALFRDGEIVARTIGARRADEIERELGLNDDGDGVGSKHGPSAQEV